MDIDDVAVIGMPDPLSGERVCAVVVLVPGRTLTLEELRQHSSAAGLAAYKKPERLEVVAHLPRNSMGKVLKRSVLQDLEARHAWWRLGWPGPRWSRAERGSAGGAPT